MPIRYRCHQCGQLISISTRMIGTVVPCPKCRRDTTVPPEDEFFPPELAQPVPEIAPLQAAPTAEFPVEPPPEPFSPSAPPAAPPPAPLAAPPTWFRRPAPAASPPAEAEESPPEPTVRIAPAPAVALVELGPEFEPAAAEEGGDDGGFSFRRPQTVFEDMDLTPMVDVTFLLLIFFMITASFSLQKSIEVPVPDSSKKGAAQALTLEELENTTIMVRIDERNGISIDDVPVRDRKDLADLLRQARITTSRTDVVIDAHADALHDTVVAVIDAAAAAEMQKVRLISKGE